MKIEHIAIYTPDLERLKLFYEQYFQAAAGPHYENARTLFQSYFLQFPEGARLELMQMPGIPLSCNDPLIQFTGLVHLAFSTGYVGEVDRLTEQLRMDGWQVVSAARRTGDGYYESVVLDPDGNRIEITV